MWLRRNSGNDWDSYGEELWRDRPEFRLRCHKRSPLISPSDSSPNLEMPLPTSDNLPFLPVVKIPPSLESGYWEKTDSFGR